MEIPILTLRDLPVLLDADLARLYGVPTKRLNEQVKRNSSRFPEDFLFQLSISEKEQVVANCDHLRSLKFSKSLPWAFTEHGALMAANVLNSPEAVKMSVFIIRAFIKQREALSTNATILRRLAELDKSLLLHDHALRDLYQKLLPLLQPPPQKSRLVSMSEKIPQPTRSARPCVPKNPEFSAFPAQDPSLPCLPAASSERLRAIKTLPQLLAYPTPSLQAKLERVKGLAAGRLMRE